MIGVSMLLSWAQVLFKQNKLKESRQKKIIPFSKGGGGGLWSTWSARKNSRSRAQNQETQSKHVTCAGKLIIYSGVSYILWALFLIFFFSEFFIFCRTTDMDCKNAVVNSSCPVRKINVMPFFESTRVKYCTGAALFWLFYSRLISARSNFEHVVKAASSVFLLGRGTAFALD